MSDRPSLSKLRGMRKADVVSYAESLGLDTTEADSGETYTAEQIRDLIRDEWQRLDGAGDASGAASSSSTDAGTGVPDTAEPADGVSSSSTDTGTEVPAAPPRAAAAEGVFDVARPPPPAPPVFRTPAPAPPPAPGAPPRSGISALTGGTVNPGRPPHVPTEGTAPSASTMSPVPSARARQAAEAPQRLPPHMVPGREGLAPALVARPIDPGALPAGAVPRTAQPHTPAPVRRANELTGRPIELPPGTVPPGATTRQAPPAPIAIERAPTTTPQRAKPPRAVEQLKAAHRAIEMARGAVLDWPDEHPERVPMLEACTELLRAIFPVVQRCEEIAPATRAHAHEHVTPSGSSIRPLSAG